MSLPLIRVVDVAHTFANGFQALADINLNVVRGAFVTLVGPSGVGKSTLLRLIGGLLIPQHQPGSTLTIAGIPPHQHTTPIGIVFQQDNLMPWRTAYQNVRLPLELQGEANGGTHTKVMEILELVGLAGFEQSYPKQLSGGMAQRVALARALVHEPELILLDEPLGALDALTRERMGQELLRIWRARPVTMFMVTHSIQEAVLLADEVLVMTGKPGQICQKIAIDLPRPRTLDTYEMPAFHHYVSTVRQAIQQHTAS